MSRTSRAYWASQLAGWGLYALVTIYTLRGAHLPIARAVGEPLAVAALGVAITHLFRAGIRRRGWLLLDSRALAPRVVAATFALSLVLVVLVFAIEVGVYGDPISAEVWVLAWMRWVLAFFAWLSIYFGRALLVQREHALVQRHRLAEALQAAELRALKSQLNPHFLFNSLNSVRALITDDPARAQDAVTQLAHTLRYALAAGDDDLVTFDRELEMVDDYLGLEALRLGERLRVERDLDRARVGGARMPVMLLQTLVENAVKHGIAQLPEGGTLKLSAHLDGGAFVLDVENPRPEPARATAGAGIGLANALERLRLLFGPGAGLSLDLSRAGHATARVRVPQEGR